MHAIAFAVAIGVKLRFDPQIMANPRVGVLKAFDFLGQAIFENRKVLAG